MRVLGVKGVEDGNWKDGGFVNGCVGGEGGRGMGVCVYMYVCMYASINSGNKYVKHKLLMSLKNALKTEIGSMKILNHRASHPHPQPQKSQF